MRFLISAGAAVFFALFSPVASARVFDLKKESFASYLSYTHGGSIIADQAVAGESSASSYADKVTTNTGGEFGFIYTTSWISWRFGFEILKPAVLDTTAQDAGGSALYNVKSDITGFMPKLGIELNLFTRNNYRVFVSGFTGQASVTVTNTYSSLTLAPNADFEMQYKGSATAMGAGIGYELAAFDTTSLLVEAGYRKLAFQKLNYGKDVTADFSSTARSAGDAVTLTSGEDRELSFSGLYFSFGARWWLF